MSIPIRFGLLTCIASLAAGMAMAQDPTQNTSPEAASSPHQRQTTGESAAESQVTSSPEPDAAASPHQQQVTGHAGADPAMFVKAAAQGGMTEVALGKIAMTHGHNPSVKTFGERMVKDHGRANTELSGVAKAKGLAVPTTLDAEHQAIVEKLGAKGSDFDAAYSAQMMADHDKTIALFEVATKSSDAELAAFAKKTLPTLKEHKRMAEALPGG
jgi:putative membrane protein